MIKRRTRPCAGGVTGLARGREKLRLRGVARVRCVVVIGLVTADAGRRQRRVVAVDMAVGT